MVQGGPRPGGQLAARHENEHDRMVTLRSVESLRATVRSWRAAGQTVGVVPTMGALHDGHLALVRRAKADCERVVATLFVNPAQFDRKEDLVSYPRDEAADAAMLEALAVDLLYAPGVEEIYPPGFATKVLVEGLTDCLCGVTRPGHLDGVTTVVSKLLLQVQPDMAYFGEKDYQQLTVVQRMARDLDIPVRIVGVPTVREPDGLALSSRNQHLSPQDRETARSLYRVIQAIADALSDGTTEAEPLLAAGRAELTAAGFAPIDYLELRTEETLELLDRADRPARIFVAAWLSGTRLIDNVPVT